MDNLYFIVDDIARPGYVIDYSGRLIKCRICGESSSLVPYSVSHIPSSSELGSNLFELSVDHLNYLINIYSNNAVISDPFMNQAYPLKRIEVVDNLYAGPHNIVQDYDQINSIIDLFNNRFDKGNYNDCVKIEEGLNKCGVFRIPFRDILLERYHISTSNKEGYEIVKHGWYNRNRVISKSILC